MTVIDQVVPAQPARLTGGHAPRRAGNPGILLHGRMWDRPCGREVRREARGLGLPSSMATTKRLLDATARDALLDYAGRDRGQRAAGEDRARRE